MKRLLLAAGMALGAHGLLLATGGDWLRQAAPVAAMPRTIRVNLEEVQQRSGPMAKVESRPQPKPATAARESDPDPDLGNKARRQQASLPAKEKPREKEPTQVGIRPVPESSAPPAAAQAFPPTAEVEDMGSGGMGTAEAREEEGSLLQGGAASNDAAASSEHAAVEADTVLARPLYRSNPPPRYPPAARRQHHEGTVQLDVLVDARGRVEDLRVAASSGYGLLDRAALDAVRDWRFEPGRQGGRPTAMRVQVPVRFALE